MNNYAKFSVGCLAILALLIGCASKKIISPVPKIQSTVSIKTAWQNHISQKDDSYFAPQLLGMDIIDAGSKHIKIIDVLTGKTKKEINLKQNMITGLGTNGSLFVLSALKGGLYAYDDQGQVVWQAQMATEAIAPAVLTSHHAIVRTIDGRITAYALEDGKQKWQFIRPTPGITLRNYAPVTTVEGLVFAGLANGQLVGITEDNAEPIWEATIANPKGAGVLERAVDVLSRPLLLNDRVCVAAYQGKIGCFKGENGASIWSQDMSTASDLTTDGRAIFGVTTNGEVQAFDVEQGHALWRLESLKGRELGAPIVFAQYIVFGDMQGYVYFVDKESGEIVAIQRVAQGAIRQQPIVYDDMIIIKTTKGSLVALRV